MKILRSFQKELSIVFVYVFLLSVTGCSKVYKIQYSSSSDEATVTGWASKSSFQFLHYNSGIKELDDVQYDTLSNTITGKVLGEYNPEWNTYYSKIKASGKTSKTFGGKNTYRVNQFHIFSDNIKVESDCTFVIPNDRITKMERLYYDPVASAKLKKKLALGLGIPLGIIGGLGVILAIICNCPHVYIYNGQEFEMQTALFAGSIHPSLERRDQFVIRNYNSEKGLRMQIRNEEKKKESQNLNDVILKAVYHSEKVSLRTDRKGGIHTIEKEFSPVKAWNTEALNILPLVSKSDKKSVQFIMNEDRFDLNQIYLNFYRPVGKNQAKILLDARNTEWSGYVIDEFFKLIGDEEEKASEYFEKSSKEQKLKWQKEQGMLMSVYIKREGKWRFEDYLDMTGTGNLREFILPIDLNGIEGDRIEVKLVAGFNLWELDYAGVDFSENEAIQIDEVKISESLFNGNKTDLGMTFADAGKYFVLEKTGDVLDLTFESVEQKEGKKLTYILSSKGYLKKHHDGSGEFNKSRLLQFMKKGEMSRFSKELMQSANSLK